MEHGIPAVVALVMSTRHTAPKDVFNRTDTYTAAAAAEIHIGCGGGTFAEAGGRGGVSSGGGRAASDAANANAAAAPAAAANVLAAADACTDTTILDALLARRFLTKLHKVCCRVTIFRRNLLQR